jgi:CubicO group peptidase (beta-lactamase class C family)/beta-glucosidase-like glycosyl hydrolase
MIRNRCPRCTSALLALLATTWGCTPRGGEGPFTEDTLAAMDLPARDAQVTAPALAVPSGGGPEADAAWARLTGWAADGVGGVLIAAAPGPALPARLDSAHAAAALPLLVVARLDRGAGGVIGGATELPALRGAAAAGEAPARDLGRLAGREARAAGVHLALVSAPAFPGIDGPPAAAPREAEERALLAFVQGLRDADLRVGLRTFAPHGVDSVPVAMRWDGAAIEAFHLGALREAAPGLDAVEGAPVVLPALTGDTLPLPLSPVFAAGLLRRDLAFDGLVVADASPAGPLGRRYGAAEAGVLALAAGADLLVGMDDPAAAAAAIVAAVEAGRIPQGRLEAAVRRVLAAKASADAHRSGGGDPMRIRTARDVDQAREAHAAAAQVLGAAPQTALRGCRLTVLALLPHAAADTLVAGLAGALPGLAAVDVDSVPLRGPLLPGADGASPSPDCALVARFGGRGPAVVPGAPAAAAGDTAAPADTVPRRIVFLDFVPGAGWNVEGAVGAVVLHGTGHDAQHAAARIVRGEAEAAAAPGLAVWPPARRLVARTPAAAGMDAGRLGAVDGVVQRAIAQGVFTSAAVAVGYRGALVKLTGYGNVSGAPVDPASTVFDLASLTKVVGTTAALMALVDDGVVDLDEPVRRYLPEFRGERRNAVTVRHLLTHTSGLPAGEWLFPRASREAALARVLAVPLLTAPGETVRYSDFGMMLLAEMVERQVEMPLDEYLARRVFGPLGMQSTFFLPATALRDSVVPTALPAERDWVLRGVVHDGNAYRLGGVTGHAGVFSTATDLSVFAQTMLNGGAYGPVRVFSEPIARGFVRRQAGADDRALGWATPTDQSSAGRFFSARSYGHLGYTGTSLWIDPDRELFVVFLANRTFSQGTIPRMAEVRRDLHDAVAQAVADQTVSARRGAR